MTREPAEWYQALVFAVLLSCVAAWIIAHRYRRRMQQLMRAPGPGDSRPSNAPAGEAAEDRPAGASVSLAENRAAGMRLTMLLIASSCLLAGTSACIFSALMFPADPLMPWRVIPIAMMHLWPVIPAIALMWRWSRARFIGALLLWCTATCVVALPHRAMAADRYGAHAPGSDHGERDRTATGAVVGGVSGQCHPRNRPLVAHAGRTVGVVVARRHTGDVLRR